jgi:putative hydrolase of the HAD superfamily
VGLGGVKAVLLDALGTLVELERPAPHLVRELGARAVAIDEAAAGRALRAEIAYYREHHDMASDRAGLAELRARCTEVLREALPPHARRVDDLQDALLGALRFRPYPEVPGVLRELRAGGARLVVVSNWDVSLHDALGATGLDTLVDGALSSAEVGRAKPDPLIFEHALRLADAAPEEAIHVGDSLEHDVAGARAAGIRPVLVAREGAGGDSPLNIAGTVPFTLRGPSPQHPGTVPFTLRGQSPQHPGTVPFTLRGQSPLGSGAEPVEVIGSLSSLIGR